MRQSLQHAVAEPVCNSCPAEGKAELVVIVRNGCSRCISMYTAWSGMPASRLSARHLFMSEVVCSCSLAFFCGSLSGFCATSVYRKVL